MKTGLSVPDSLCTATPSPQEKSEKGCLWSCLLYTSDAADERSSVDLGGRRIIKNTGHGNFVIGRLHTIAKNGSSVSDCVQSRPPHRNPFSDFFCAEEAAVHRLSGTDNPVFESQEDCSFKIKTIPFSN